MNLHAAVRPLEVLAAYAFLIGIVLAAARGVGRLLRRLDRPRAAQLSLFDQDDADRFDLDEELVHTFRARLERWDGNVEELRR